MSEVTETDEVLAAWDKLTEVSTTDTTVTSSNDTGQQQAQWYNIIECYVDSMEPSSESMKEIYTI